MFKPSALIALLLTYCAMVGAVVVSHHTFDTLPHLEDEYTYLFQARIFQEGDVYIPTPQPNRAYWQPFLINLDGKRFGKYPPGWPLLLAVATKGGLPWAANMWFAGLTVAIVYRFGRELYDEMAGVAGAALMTISPIALLLSGTLMSHTSTLFFVMLFVYGLWRLERGKRLYFWGAVAGVSLGIVVASRPLAGAGIVAPFILYCLLRLGWLLIRDRSQFLPALKPLVVLGLMASLFAGMFPAFNYIISGDPLMNFYTLVWSYDTVGFGEGHGRYSGQEVSNSNVNGIKINMRSHAGHNPERGWRNTKRDLTCYSRDLFGWTQRGDNPPTAIPASNNDCVVDKNGLSWVLLPLGFLLMYRRKWTSLLLLMVGSLVLVHIAYWIGAGIYSARYYFEATGALAMISGAGIAGLVRLTKRWDAHYLVYAVFFVMLTASLVKYTPQRLAVLDDYGRIDETLIPQVKAMRTNPDQPVLVIAYGPHHWRESGALMALTDPYMQNDIVLLRDIDRNYTENFLQQYADHEILFLINKQLYTRAEWEQDPLLQNYGLN